MNHIVKKHIITMGALVLAASLTAGCSLFSKFNSEERKTLSSLKKVSDNVWTMDYYADYKVDEYLTANINNVKDFDAWMTKNLTHNVPTGDEGEYGCSSFAVASTDGGHLFGRNYDMNAGDSLVLRTKPKTGYASIGIVDLSHANLGNGGHYKMDDKDAKALLLAAPWCISDGINEKGLGVSLLSLDDEHVVNDTEKDDLLLYSSLRVVLDKCATVDEAVTFLQNYDMYSPGHHSYHMFLTDTSGRAVVLEWYNGDMYVVEDHAVTNHYLFGEDAYDIDKRYTKIHQTIDGASAFSAEEAMNILHDVYQGTRWSAVYDLEKFSVTICFNGKYDESVSYTGSR